MLRFSVTGHINFFCLEERVYCNITIDELLHRGLEISTERNRLDAENPDYLDKECNMKNKDQTQKVFMVQGIDSDVLRLLMKAFNLNRELKHEM